MTASTFYWYDYETFGTHPALDRPAQFAGIRTDLELNHISEPLRIYNRLTPDYLPDPNACRITGIGPATVRNGLTEQQFITRINQELSQPDTCLCGYNNIRFDDEFTRFTLFRNFFDPYEHEWRNGNSRWDMLDVVRLTRALRPDGIIWPYHEDGKPSNRLEHLSAANGLTHAQAHDALSDVYATIEVAQLIRRHQPRLYQYAFQHRDKHSAAAALDLREQTPVVHISGMISSEHGHAALVVPVVRHPTNRNGIVVIDLRDDPAELEEMDVDTLRHRLFNKTGELAAPRLRLKTVHLNRAPVLVPLSTLDAASAERLSIDVPRSLHHRDTLRKMNTVAEKISQAIEESQFPPAVDVDASLYSGGFFSDSDRRRFALIRSTPAQQLAARPMSFDDSRIDEMLFRYRARNFLETLNPEEIARWQRHCSEQITRSLSGASRLQRFDDAIEGEIWPANEADLKRDLVTYRNRVAAAALE